jgi:2-keto-3-deoxy-L-rhamnonate aldolase RhmA
MGMVGFDWLLIDMEHGNGDYQTLLHQIYAINAVGNSTPIVRVQWNDPIVIKRTLEAGAEGIMVPGIRTSEEAKRAVAATRYPPHGIRSVSHPRASLYGNDPKYIPQAQEEVAIFIQIETKDAVDNIDSILEVPGVDVAFVGPHDLSADIGHLGNPQHPEVQAAIAKVEASAKAHNVPLGTVSGSTEIALAHIDKGYQAMALMSDIAYLLGGAKATLASVLAHPMYKNARK